MTWRVHAAPQGRENAPQAYLRGMERRCAGSPAPSRCDIPARRPLFLQPATEGGHLRGANGGISFVRRDALAPVLVLVRTRRRERVWSVVRPKILSQHWVNVGAIINYHILCGLNVPLHGLLHLRNSSMAHRICQVLQVLGCSAPGRSPVLVGSFSKSLPPVRRVAACLGRRRGIASVNPDGQIC